MEKFVVVFVRPVPIVPGECEGSKKTGSMTPILHIFLSKRCSSCGLLLSWISIKLIEVDVKVNLEQNAEDNNVLIFYLFCVVHSK